MDQKQFVPAFKRAIASSFKELNEDHIIETGMAAGQTLLLDAVGRTVLCRAREAGYEKKFPTQFTLRSRRPLGDNGTTELARVLGGLGDYYLYSHANPVDPHHLTRWLLLDLAVFRAHYGQSHVVTGEIISRERGSGSRWFESRSFPSSLVVGEGTYADAELSLGGPR